MFFIKKNNKKRRNKKNKGKLFSFPRLFAYSFATIAMVQALSLGLSLQAPEIAYARSATYEEMTQAQEQAAQSTGNAGNEAVTYTMQVPIPGLGKDGVITFGNSTANIANYVKAIYNYAVGIVGILAAIMIMVGGFRWIVAGGNASAIGEAKEIIFAALSGLVLVMASYLILSQINPALINFKITSIMPPNIITKKDLSNPLCKWIYYPTKGAWYIHPRAHELIDACKKYYTPYTGTDWIKAEKEDYCGDKPAEQSEQGQACCCLPLPDNGCPKDYTIPCLACPECEDNYLNEIKRYNQTESHISCKDSKSCSANDAMESSMLILNDKLTELKTSEQLDINLLITEAWPPTVPHSSRGHRDGSCVDVVIGESRDISVNSVEKVYSAMTESGFSTVLFECYPNDRRQSCNCDHYNIPTSKCGQTESGENAGGYNHFHVCN